ncbi:MAG: chemotaxis protein [Chlorobi bacterium]|nr:chemotaxis protein [Chlorobiota bacterium]
MSELLRIIDARTKLAGTNKVELLLFQIGSDPATGTVETYGINVFKVREIMIAPRLHHPPQRQTEIEGMLSLRGSLIPVVNLPAYCGTVVSEPPKVLIVTEYNDHTQGFLVERVETIYRCDWSQVRTPPPTFASSDGHGIITAVVETASRGLILLLDVEKILLDTIGVKHDDAAYGAVEPLKTNRTHRVVYCDDSLVARRQIEQTLERFGVEGISFPNGKRTWDYLQQCAAIANSQNIPVTQLVSLVLSDIEMPEMDGFALTRCIKADHILRTIPVVLHSSLSGTANEHLGRSVGADAYVSKFEPSRLADTLRQILEHLAGNVTYA